MSNTKATPCDVCATPLKKGFIKCLKCHSSFHQKCQTKHSYIDPSGQRVPCDGFAVHNRAIVTDELPSTSDANDEYSDTILPLPIVELDILKSSIVDHKHNILSLISESRDATLKRTEIENALGELSKIANNIASAYTLLANRSQTENTNVALINKTLSIFTRSELFKNMVSSLVDDSLSGHKTRSFAEAASTGPSKSVQILPQTFVPLEKTTSVVIGPNPVSAANFQSSEQTRKALRSAVNPASANMKVVRMTNSKNNSVRIMAADINIEKLKKNPALSACGLEVKEDVKMNPRLLVRGVPAGLSAVEVRNNLISQNLDDLVNPDIKMIYKYPTNGRDYVSHVIETSPVVRNALLIKDRIFVDWSSCRVVDHVTVLQCYRCLNFGHKSNNCPGPPHCAHCSGDHESKECKIKSDEPKCFNCVLAKCESTSHSAFNGDACEVRKRRIMAKIKHINYG